MPRAIKEDYTLAKCCSPEPADSIRGYYSHDNIIKVHKSDCGNLENIEPERLIALNWDDIVDDDQEFSPDETYFQLDAIDFEVLAHHLEYGVDYAHVVARKRNISRQEAFDSHKKLKELSLIERVEPKIIQYRKGIVDNKWIKHRNHTYYQLTKAGEIYIKYYLSNK